MTKTKRMTERRVKELQLEASEHEYCYPGFVEFVLQNVAAKDADEAGYHARAAIHSYNRLCEIRAILEREGSKGDNLRAEVVR